MAKQIKTLKCPQCGSVHILEKKTDFYECQSCGTDFFLDSNDITIHHKHYPASQEMSKKVVYLWIGLGLLLFLGFVMPLFVSLLTQNASPLVEKIKEEVVEDPFVWDIEQATPFLNDQNQAFVFIYGKKSKKSEKLNTRWDKKYHYGVFDVQKGEEVFSSLIEEAPKGAFGHDTRFISFENGSLFVLLNTHSLYEFNKNSFELIKKEGKDFEIEALQAGFAKIDHYKVYGDGLKVMTNLGKELYFYPTSLKVYESREALYQTIRKRPEGAVKKQAFAFSFPSRDFPEEKIQLIAYEYWAKEGDPYDEPLFRWDKDYGGSGIFTGSSPYTKNLISQWEKERARLVSFKDFTPDRYYFSAEVLFADQTHLLIRYKPNLSPDAVAQVQLLDAETALVKWTLPLSETMNNTKNALSLGDGGFLLFQYRSLWLVDAQGKVQKEISLSELLED